MPFAKLDGVDLYYEVHGRGSPIVFLHGGGGDHSVWANQVPHFAERFRVIIADQRGFGASPPYDPDTIGETRLLERDLDGLLAHLGDADGVVLIGHSLGSHPALEFTTRHPGRVKGLILSSAYGGLTSDTLNRGAAERIETVRDAHRRVSTVQAGDHGHKALPVPADNEVRTSLIHDIITVTAPEKRPSITDLIRSLEDYRRIEKIEAGMINTPALLLAGDRDYIPAWEFEEASQFFTEAGFRIIPHAAHASYREQPDVFNALVDEFLSRT